MCVCPFPDKSLRLVSIFFDVKVMVHLASRERGGSGLCQGGFGSKAGFRGSIKGVQVPGTTAHPRNTDKKGPKDLGCIFMWYREGVFRSDAHPVPKDLEGGEKRCAINISDLRLGELGCLLLVVVIMDL